MWTLKKVKAEQHSMSLPLVKQYRIQRKTFWILSVNETIHKMSLIQLFIVLYQYNARITLCFSWFAKSRFRYRRNPIEVDYPVTLTTVYLLRILSHYYLFVCILHTWDSPTWCLLYLHVVWAQTSTLYQFLHRRNCPIEYQQICIIIHPFFT